MTDQSQHRNASEEHSFPTTEVTGEEVTKAGKAGALIVWPGIVMAAIAMVVILYLVLR